MNILNLYGNVHQLVLPIETEIMIPKAQEILKILVLEILTSSGFYRGNHSTISRFRKEAVA